VIDVSIPNTYLYSTIGFFVV